MSATSAWPIVLEALRTRLAARPGYRLPSATASAGATTVYVGAQPVGTADPGDWVLLGASLDSGDVAGGWDQNWAAMAPTIRPRDEAGTISVLILATSGDPDPLVTMRRAFAALAGLELAIASDPRLGVPTSTLSQLTVSPPSGGLLSWSDTDRGGSCLLSATIKYVARISGVSA